jgi:hypothetical protein
MRLLSRIAFIWIVLGLLTGLFLRTRKNVSMRWLVAFTLLPWFLHQLYIYVTLEFALPPNLQLIFVGLSLLFAVAAAVVGWMFAKKRSPIFAAVPFVHGFVYSILLLVLANITRTGGLGLNTVSWTVFASAVLFLSSMLLSYLFRVNTPKLPGFSLRRTRK